MKKYFLKKSFFISGLLDEIDPSIKSIALFGDKMGNSKALANLNHWLNQDENNCVYVVHHEKDIKYPFSKTNSKQINEMVNKRCNDLDSFFENEEIRLKAELEKWNSLEDYERVKVPRHSNEETSNFNTKWNECNID